MDRSMESNVSKPLGNQLKDISPMQLNEDAEFSFMQNAGTWSSIVPFNDDDDIFGVNNMSMVDPAQSLLCANLLGNMEGKTESHVQGPMDDNDNTVIGDPLFSNFWIPQMTGKSFANEGNMAIGVQPQNLGGAATILSDFRDGTVNIEDDMDFSSLFGNIQRPQDDINNQGNAEVQQHYLGGTTTETDNFTSVAYHSNTFKFPQIIESNTSIGGNTIPGAQLDSQGGTATSNPHVPGVGVNNVIRFSSLLNNYRSPQTERSSINIGSNIPHITQRNSQGGAAIGTSYVQGVRSNGDTSLSIATQSHNLQSPQINRSSISIGGKGAAAIQPNCQSDTGSGRSRVHGVTIDGNVCSQQINKIPITIDGGLTSRMRTNSQDEKRDGTNVPSKPLLSNGIHCSDRNFLSIGGSMPEGEQSQTCEKLRVINNVKTRDSRSNSTEQSNSAICPEQIENTLLNLGYRVNATAGFQSNALGGGISNNNGCPVTTQSHTFDGPQTDGNFLSLGENSGDQTRFNNANTIVSRNNSGVNSNPYMNVGGNKRNQTWSNNASRNIWSINAGVSSNPFTVPQTVQGNVHQYVMRPSGRIMPPGGNGAGMSVNTIPHGVSHGYSGVPLRPFNSMPTGVHAHDQARMSSSPLGSSYLNGRPNVPSSNPLQQDYMNNVRRISTNPPMASPLDSTAVRNSWQHQSGRPNVPFLNPLQQDYMNNVRRISTNPPMASPLDNTTVRTVWPDQSGYPVPVDDTIVEAAKRLTDLSYISKQVQTDQATTPICRRGKRVPADGIQYAPSAKVLLGPSLSGKPVPLSGRAGLARTYEGLLGQTVQNSKIPNASTVLRAARGRNIPQPTNSPTVSGSQTAVYHVRWKDSTEPYQSSGENCHLCKRDLTYTATGPVTQPPVPPAVAVLPCGHTFHDECLQCITPEDQLKNPPCIPCAIGTP